MASSAEPSEEARSLPGSTSERTHLLGNASLERRGESRSIISSGLVARLYISHFLSTWNSRVFEFGAVLYLATIFPGTLLPISVYAIMRGIAAIALSPAVGRYVDTGNRLHVVRVSVCAWILRPIPIDYPSLLCSSPGPGVIKCVILISSVNSMPASCRSDVLRHFLRPPRAPFCDLE